jgi:hypothetical protein
VAAKGTRTWATTEVAEATPIASASSANWGARRGDAGDRQQDGDQLAAVDQVAERGEEDEAEPVGDLRDGDQEAGGAVGDAEGVGDRREQRLRVVEVGDGRPATDCEQRDQPAIDGLGGRRHGEKLRAGGRRLRATRHLSPASRATNPP